MPCDEYEHLVQAWTRAHRQEDSAYNPGSRQLQSNKQFIENRANTTAEREKCEYAMAAHLTTCEQCTAVTGGQLATGAAVC